ncbi:c-type cytochrome [Pendulispora albinea]|uniref:Cytochrome c n=1 Tax=Pendulispora albinea TaxID=2741071 RepID=A0ABZ2M311_9BACT
MKRSTAAGLIALLASMGLGCSSSDESLPPGELTLGPVVWNPSNIAVGQVQAVAEYDKTVAVFGASGVSTFTSGALVGSDASVTSWRSAAVIPSASGLGTWIVGIDGKGRMKRVLGHEGIEDVSDRFGLTSEAVSSLAGSTGATGFLTERGIATSDGTTVTHYPSSELHAVAAGAGRVAVAVAGGVRIFDPSAKGRETDVALPDARFVAFDAAGALFSATPRGLYKLEGGEMRVVYDAGARAIRALAAAGPHVWFAVDRDLGMVRDGRVFITSAPPSLGDDLRLAGSPDGDVWVVTGGQLFRYEARFGGASGDEAIWTDTVQPAYARVCSNCHSAPGSGKASSNVDLSTYALWNARRAAIRERVITQAGTPGAMPPSGYTLTEEEKAAIDAWTKR